MRTFAVLVFGLLLTGSAFAAEKREPKVDEYVACVVGHAIVEMHYGNHANADDVAFDACEALSKPLTSDDREGAYEYVQALLTAIDDKLI